MINNLSLAVSLGFAVIGLASPAHAFAPLEGAASAAVTRVPSNQSNASGPAAKDPAANKYCLTMEAATGSRMVTRECKTRAEWEMLGYELSEK